MALSVTIGVKWHRVILTWGEMGKGEMGEGESGRHPNVNSKSEFYF